MGSQRSHGRYQGQPGPAPGAATGHLSKCMPVSSLCLMSRWDSMVGHRILKNNLNN